MGGGASCEARARGWPAAQRAPAQRAVQLYRDPGVLCARGAHASMEDHRLTEEIAHEGGGGLFVERARRANLLDAPAVHHRDAVGEAERLDLVVGDEEHGDAEAALEELDFHAHLLTELRVEIAERLVEEEEIRLVDEGAAEGEALHLPAAQERARPLAEPAEADQVEDAFDLLAEDGPRRTAEAEGVGDVLYLYQVGHH